MKKIISMVLVLVMALSLMAGCGTKNNTTDPSGTVASTNGATPAPETNSQEVLEKIWKSFNEHAAEDEKFPVSGGDSENPTMDGPGKVDITNADTLGFTLNLAADLHKQIDEAASLMHAMNANTFTAAAYHVTKGTDLNKFVSTAAEGIKNTQWICGFPEHLVVATVYGEYVIVAYGAEAIIGQVKNEITAAYPEAVIAVDEPLE